MADWEQKTVEKLLLEGIKEQRRSRRWKNFFKMIIFTYITLLLLGYYFKDGKIDLDKPHSALIEINGVISAKKKASSKKINNALRKAFKDKGLKGVILSINSPGGSPVQADQIFSEVRRLEKHYPKIKVYAVCNDVCASAAYYVAASADKIYANPSSMVGSIGVLMNGFGFVDTMHKIGVTRRLVIAGKHKGFMDPFSPLNPEDLAYTQKLLDIVHNQFIQRVKEGRGKRLSHSPELFTGRVWTGEQSMKLGLIDGFGGVGDIARDVIKAKTVINYTQRQNPFERWMQDFMTEFNDTVVGRMKTKIEAISS